MLRFGASELAIRGTREGGTWIASQAPNMLGACASDSAR
jgi:hypothetical protein